MKRFVITRTTPANPSVIAALLGGIGLFLAIAAGQMVHAQTDPAGVDNSAYGELVGERYKNEEAPKGKEKSGAHQRHDAKKGSERSGSQDGAGREDKPVHSPSGDEDRQGNR